MSSCIQEARQSVYKTKLEEGKDDPKTIWKLFKEFGANSKKGDDSGCLEIRKSDDIISNDLDLAEFFNDYFINIAANLQEPIKQSTLMILWSILRRKFQKLFN